MHPLMKHRKKWGPHSLKWPQPISLSFSNMFSNSVFYMQSKTAWWFWSFLAQCFLFICEWRDTELPARLPMTREWLLRLPAWGEKMRCYSQWRHGAEKVGDETKMCLFMPTGVLTLLQAAIAFCQERELKGHSPDMKTSTAFPTSTLLPLALLLVLLLGQLWYPIGAEGGELFPLRFIQEKKTEKAGSVSLRWIWRCQSAHGQLVFQSRGEGQIEFRVSAMTDGCRGTLVSAAAPQRPGLTGC